MYIYLNVHGIGNDNSTISSNESAPQVSELENSLIVRIQELSHSGTRQSSTYYTKYESLCCCGLHIKLFVLPNDISSTRIVLPDSSS